MLFNLSQEEVVANYHVLQHNVQNSDDLTTSPWRFAYYRKDDAANMLGPSNPNVATSPRAFIAKCDYTLYTALISTPHKNSCWE